MPKILAATAALGVAVGALCAGCAHPPELLKVPVAGRVTAGGIALTDYAVFFNPDADRGNFARVGCVGRIGSDGRYELRTVAVNGDESGPGAPPGWYRVAVQPVDDEGFGDPLPFDRRYADLDRTPLQVEVTAHPLPGGYDFVLHPE